MIIKLDADSYQSEVLESEGPVLVDFAAPWCGPCKRVSKILEELDVEQTAVKLAKLDIDDYPDIAAKNGITSIPVLIYYKDGKEVGRLLGAKPKSAVEELISK